MKETKNNKSPIRKIPAAKRTSSRASTKAKASAAPAPVKAAIKPAMAKTSAEPTRAIAPTRQPVATEIIAARAYTLWERDGRPHGRDMDYWLRAENELQQETQPQPFAA